MNLFDLRTEVVAHQVNETNVARINMLINNALRELSRKVDFYQEETAYPFTTTAGMASYSWPTDLGKARFIADTSIRRTLQAVRMRQIDQAVAQSGRPYAYAVDGPGIVLWPTPDSTYSLNLRYFKLPDLLVNDTDVPALPDDYHQILTYYALSRAYEAEDDLEMASYYAQQWEKSLAAMKVDVKFPTTDGPRRVDGMWDTDPLMVPGWGWGR